MLLFLQKMTTLMVTVSMLSSCAVVVPTLNETNTFERCDVFTKKIELDIVSQKISPFHCRNEMCAAFLVVSAGVFATSVIISSSIYLVGNTVHYLEKEARCNDRSIVDKKVVAFSEQMEAEGGKKIKLDNIEALRGKKMIEEYERMKAEELGIDDIQVDSDSL